MALEYFDDEVNAETVGASGFELVSPGFYQMRVVRVTENEKGNLEVDMEVVGGTKPSEVNKNHREFFSMNAKTMNRKRRTALAMAADLITAAQMERAKETKEGVSIDYHAAVNHHIVVEIEHSEKQKLNEATGEWVGTGKYIAKVPFDNIWHIDSKEVLRKKVPVDKSKISLDPFGSPPKEHTPSDGDF